MLKTAARRRVDAARVYNVRVRMAHPSVGRDRVQKGVCWAIVWGGGGFEMNVDGAVVAGKVVVAPVAWLKQMLSRY